MKLKSPASRAAYLVVALVLILGAWALRLYHLGTLSLWIDEGFSWEVARQGPGAIFTLLAAEDRHPPLHYLLLWATMSLAGQSEFALRYLSAGIGLLAIPLTYRLGRDLGQPLAGAIAAALLAINPFHVWYSQEARMYALLTTLGLVSLWFWLRVIQDGQGEDPPLDRRSLVDRIAFVATTTAALYTHYYAVFFLLVEAITAGILLVGRDRRFTGMAETERAGPNPPAPLPVRGKGGVREEDRAPRASQAETHAARSSSSTPPFPRTGRGAGGLGPAPTTPVPITPDPGFSPVATTRVPGQVAGFWRRPDHRLLDLLVLLALPPLLFSPWLFAMVRQYSRAGHGYEPDLGPGSLLSQVVTNYVLGDWTTIGGTFVLAVAIVALFGVLPAWPRAHDSRDSIDPEVLPRPERHGLILLTAAFAAPVGAYLLTLLTGIDLRATGRMYYLPGVPPFLLLVGRGLVWLGDGLSRVLNQIRDEKRAEWAGFAARIPPIQHAFHPGFGSSLVAVAGFVGIVAGTTPYLTHQYVARLKQDFRGAAGYVQQHEWPGDAVILDAEYIFRPFSYYYHGAAPWYRAVVEPGAAEAALAKETSGRERVWLVLSHDGFADPDHRVQTWLDQHGVELDEAWFEGVHLRLYAMDHHPMLTRPDVGHPVDLRFGSQVSLVGTDLPSRASGGSDLHLRLVWHDLAPIDEDLHATLLLTGSDGRVWWQTDHAPISPYYLPTRWQPGEYLIDRYDLPLPLGLPPGPYQLVVKLYSPRTGQALAVAGQPTATLGTLQVGATHLDALRSGTDVAPGLRLIDASLDRAQARPGDDVTALLTWEATSAAPGLVSVSLVGPSGVAAATVADPFARGTTVGAVLRVPIALHLPARAVPGAYRVQVGSNDPNAGALQVRPISRSFAPPAVEYPQTATLSQPNGSPLVGLDGYDLSATSLAPGATFRLTLYWQARGEGSTDYTVFTHLIGPDGQIHAQKDSAPDAGQRPTSGWLKGEVVRDPYDLSLDPKAPPGEYYLEVGMYRPDTGARLMDGDNSAIILKERIRVGQAR